MACDKPAPTGPSKAPSAIPPDDVVREAVERLGAQIADGTIELLGESGSDPVVLAEPDPGWPARFRDVRTRLIDALGDVALRVDHVGSTAVPDMAAKPIIDVQVSVQDIDDEPAFAPAIESLGWRLRVREAGHRFFRSPAGEPRDVHVHVCAVGSERERHHLLFRDYLRAHPKTAQAYAALKRELAERYRNDRWGYTEGKTPFIEETTKLAEAWAKETSWSLDRA